MLATITQLFGRPAAYYTPDFDPTRDGVVHLYGDISDTEIQSLAAQRHNGQPNDFKVYRPDAA